MNFLIWLSKVRIMIMTGTTINIDNLRNIVHFVETHKYLTCSQNELIGIGCSECPYYVSDKMLRCYIYDELPTLIR